MTNPERAQDKQDAAEVKNFTKSPNMLIFGYRDISPQEKWLYVCLKHLCGARGTRHLALRYISEQTGISVGALSRSKNKQGVVNEGMIRHLHDAGLIHSEIKKKDGRGNPLYHITITDVWALNQAFFIERKTSRSDFGQDEDETIEPVRNSDIPVQNSDKLVQISDATVRISDEPVRIPGQYQDYSKTNNKITDKTDKQEGTYSDDTVSAASGAFAPSPAPSSQDEPYHPDFSASQAPAIRELSPVLDEAIEHVDEQRATLASAQDSVADENASHSQLSTLTVEKTRQQSAKVEPAKPRQSRKKAAPVLEFTAEGRKVYDAWCSLFKSPPRTAEKTVDCANDLYSRLVPWCQELHLPCKDLLKEIKGWLYTTDPDWYRRKGVTLCDIGSKFENWQSAKEESLSNPEPPPAPRTSGKFRQESKPKDPGTVEWWDQQTGVKRLMTYAEADENGWNGGFGEFIQHTHYGRTVV